MTNSEVLFAQLNSENEKERAFAAEDIGYEGLVAGIQPLIERLQVESSRFVREVIVNTLKTLPGPELVAAIIPLLRSDDAFIRNASIDILAVQDETAINVIKSLLYDPDKDVRKFALDVVFQLNQKQYAEMIAAALEDPDVNIIITAVEYLGRMEASDYIDRINEIFDTTDNILLRCTCLETMAVIGNKQSIDCVAQRYPDYTFINVLELFSYLKFVAKKGTEVHLPLIISLMREKGQLMAKEIINAVEGILRRSRQNYIPAELLQELSGFLSTKINDINKYELLVLLGEFKNEEIYPLLLKYIDPGNKLVCLGAVEGLGLYGNSEAHSILQDLKGRIDDDDILEAIEKAIE